MKQARIVCQMLLLMLAAVLLSYSAPGIAHAEEQDTVTRTIDRLYLTDGSIIEGNIVSENDDAVVVEVIVGNIKPQQVTYPRSRIIYIEYDQPVKGKDADSKAKKDKNEDPDAVPVCILELKGRFGFNISKTPLREAFEAIDKTDTKIVVLKLDCREGNVFSLQDVFDVIDEYVNDKWRDDGPKVVFWVKTALEGAGFLPFVSKYIYFTHDGVMGGVTNFDDQIRKAPAEGMIIDKWIAATMGHVEGIAIQGGYDPRIVRAMVIEKYVLSVDFVGGEPVYHEDLSGQYILTDSGEGEYADKKATEGGEQVARLVNNDVLNLDDEMAYRLRISDGTADTIDELMSLLGVRKWRLVEGKPQRAIEKWSEGIDREVPRLQEMIAEIRQRMGQVNGDYNQRRRMRGSIMNQIKKVMVLVDRYEEVLDPNQNFRMTLESWLDDLKAAQQQDYENKGP